MAEEEWQVELFGVIQTAFPMFMVYLVAECKALQINSDMAKQRSRCNTRNLLHPTLKTKVKDKSYWAIILMHLFRVWMTFLIHFLITTYRGHHNKKDRTNPLLRLCMVLAKGQGVRKFHQNNIQEKSRTAFKTLCTKPMSLLTVLAKWSLSKKFKIHNSSKLTKTIPSTELFRKTFSLRWKEAQVDLQMLSLMPVLLSANIQSQRPAKLSFL